MDFLLSYAAGESPGMSVRNNVAEVLCAIAGLPLPYTQVLQGLPKALPLLRCRFAAGLNYSIPLAPRPIEPLDYPVIFYIKSSIVESGQTM